MRVRYFAWMKRTVGLSDEEVALPVEDAGKASANPGQSITLTGTNFDLSTDVILPRRARAAWKATRETRSISERR